MIHPTDWGRAWRQHLHQGSDEGGARAHQETPRDPTAQGSLSRLTLKATVWNFSHSFPETWSPGLLSDSIIAHLFCHYLKTLLFLLAHSMLVFLKMPFVPSIDASTPPIPWFLQIGSPTITSLFIIYSHHSKSFRFPKTQDVQNWTVFPYSCYFLSSGKSHCHLLWHSVNHQNQVILSLIHLSNLSPFLSSFPWPSNPHHLSPAVLMGPSATIINIIQNKSQCDQVIPLLANLQSAPVFKG